MTRVRTAAPFSCSSWPSTCTRLSSSTPSSSAARASGAANSASTSSLETVFNAARTEGGARAARGVALHVDRDRVHRNVRGRGFHVHRERGGVAAQALRPDPEQVDRLAERALELRALGILAAAAERPRGGHL